MRYLSICSGIEAASVAWHDLGWTPVGFSEIEPFPSAVLAHRFPSVPNFGDMNGYPTWPVDDAAIDLLVGGTPCQAFSVAGKREGLADERGNLTLTFCRLADHFDPGWIVWENVPGVLSSKDNAFGCFLGELAGESCALEPAGGKWTDAGYVAGPKRAIAWRVLDAQYFGVAQRRRRVFVVASARDGFDPAAVLFEFEGLRRDTPPSREAGEGAAAGAASGATGCHWPADVASTPNAAFGSKLGLEDQHINGGAPLFVPKTVSVHGTQDPDIRLDHAHTLGRNNGTENAVCFQPRYYSDRPRMGGEPSDVCHTLSASAAQGDSSPHVACPVRLDHAHTLGRNNGQENAVLSVALRGRDGGATAELGDEVSGCLRASSGGGDKPHVIAPVAIPIHDKATRHQGGGDTRNNDGSANGLGIGKPTDPAPTITAGDRRAVAFAENSRAEVRLEGGDGQRTGALSSGGGKPGQGTPMVMEAMAVRRLTPVECERLQGFPDSWTDVPYRGKPAADGPRYKALGNSMAVPCMAWIGRRIAAVAGG